ncbi:sodium-translocating pyrophosphatase [candidate division KSB1 bacterium]|nr:sodium-translocating pyrophosphatase [candidate division KSB1 bacterium]NIR69916.1 sodium-translocating pyrophosphatase [candidate division KSB1 bacterium]NIS25825.1 sodium-translocating pyrophosphatase [candidate division KSB1 bacterium]NIT72700.1 sodium-translocating pyrophosphatase [candidate division KSB1 bacterium]NIU26514.1 sodium-translocating pyrophosphatase [candidate division KSB1 bacterium]
MPIIPIAASLLAIAFVIYLSLDVMKKDPGNSRMVEISKAVQEGAKAFLKREFIYIGSFVVVISILIALAPLFAEVELGWRTSVAFITGACASALAGYIGMSIATRSNSRTTQGALSGGLRGALSVAVSGGAVMGMSVVGISLLGLCIMFYIFQGNPIIINGYAMGASLVALFARSGGGIFTKGADMGADLVGKVEAGIPEDDPRNPAVIADNVGDNVGDVAGLGADLLESYVESIIAAIAIAAFIGFATSDEIKNTLQMLPLYIASAGIVSSIIGVLFVRIAGRTNPQGSLMGGTYVSAALTAIVTYFIVKFYGAAYTEDGTIYSAMGPFWATISGVLAGIIVGFFSEYFTSGKYRPVKRLAEDSKSGPALTVTGGISVGMASTAVPVIALAVAVMIAYHVAGIYGVALAAFGMLATTGMVVAVDSYGPIADNAGGIAEMAELDPKVRNITDNLDAVGNTTAAIGKGFAIGSAAFAALGLLVAYMKAANVDVADIKDPKVLAGLLIGGMFPFLISSMLFKAVSKAAFRMIEEVRRQFKEIPGLMEGKVLPDSARCVDISTTGAIQGMLVPGSLAIVTPVIIGKLLGPHALAGLLVGALVTGVMLGIQMANSGGAMDNAKKYIEDGHFGGKGSETHKATVIGDTVGDPLKDTVGPSINILIKLMAVISLVLAPLFIQ